MHSPWRGVEPRRVGTAMSCPPFRTYLFRASTNHGQTSPFIQSWCVLRGKAHSSGQQAVHLVNTYHNFTTTPLKTVSGFASSFAASNPENSSATLRNASENQHHSYDFRVGSLVLPISWSHRACWRENSLKELLITKKSPFQVDHIWNITMNAAIR